MPALDNADAAKVSARDLAKALRLYAEGSWPAEAAAEVFIRDHTFLCRTTFRKYIDLYLHDDKTLSACIAWARVAQDLDNRRIAGSGGELRNLRIMSHLADDEGLGGSLSGTDVNSVGLILHGVAHAAGWHQTRRTPAPYFTVTGRFDTAPKKEVPPTGRVACSTPTFEQCRAQARKLVGDAGDMMIGDWVGENPTPTQMVALRTYQKAITAARAALDAAAV